MFRFFFAKNKVVSLTNRFFSDHIHKCPDCYENATQTTRLLCLPAQRHIILHILSTSQQHNFYHNLRETPTASNILSVQLVPVLQIYLFMSCIHSKMLG